MSRDAVILFLRYPERGTVKTRLAREIGNDLAYELYVCFIRDLLEVAGAVDAETIIVGTGSTGAGPPGIFGAALRLVQHGRDLGVRMYNAFIDIFDRGYTRAVLIGSDCPGLPADYIRGAFRELESHDAVIGPSRDGGYYLIGFTEQSLRKEVFRGIPWSTPRVFADTLDIIEDRSLEVSILPQWEDIDDLEDLKRFAGDRGRSGQAVHTMAFIERNRDILFDRR